MDRDKWSVDHFIFTEYSTNKSSLGIYRILFATCILFVYLPQHLWISRFPDSFFTPPLGPTAILFTGFPGLWFFRTLNLLEIIATIFLLIGCRTRLASLCLALLLFAGNCWAFSFGKINHDILMILAPLVMAFSTWGRAYSIDASKTEASMESRGDAWPIALLALLTAFGMMNAAVPKAASGWLNPHSHAVLAHILKNTFVTGRSSWIATKLMGIHSGLFWESLDYATVALEASFLLLVGRRRTFRVACAAACFFHLGIALTMDIAYWPNLLVYGAFTDWNVLENNVTGNRLLRLWESTVLIFTPFRAFVLGSLVSVVYLVYGNPLHKVATLLPPESDPLGLIVCIFGVLVATMFLANWFKAKLAKFPQFGFWGHQN